MSYRIKLTDSVCIDDYSYLKPEIETEFEYGTSVKDATKALEHDLQRVVLTQLCIIVDRMSRDDMKRIHRKANVDPRFREIIKARYNTTK